MLQSGLSFVLASVFPPVIYTAQVGLGEPLMATLRHTRALGVSKAVG